MKTAYFVLETQKFISGDFIALLAREGESGYYRTDIMLGKDEGEAQKVVDTLNERMGIDQREATRIICSTMR